MDARPKEVTLSSLFSETKDSSLTQRKLIHSAKAEEEFVSGATSSIQEENIGSEDDITIRFLRSVKSNTCIKKFVYRVIYNYFFAIPICKKHRGCKEKMRTVTFANGKTLAITFDCYR